MEVMDYLAQFDHTKKLPGDISGDERYQCFRGGERFLLRVADGAMYEQRKREFEHLRQLGKTVAGMPRCIDLRVSDSGKNVFMLLSWVAETKN